MSRLLGAPFFLSFLHFPSSPLSFLARPKCLQSDDDHSPTQRRTRTPSASHWPEFLMTHQSTSPPLFLYDLHACLSYIVSLCAPQESYLLLWSMLLHPLGEVLQLVTCRYRGED
ncbi:hypothetical protein BGZ63DRAFT_372540 [Mariannaea sp. PMI_226]|nr:hypothetical protein BGZ63DRAFT_372540 [Mariannaea sp. PMI_226]